MAETSKDFPRRFHLGPATIGTVVVILLATAPLVMDAFFGGIAYRQVRSLRYETTTGVVTASAVQEHESTDLGGPRHTYSAAVKYHYFVAGKAYSGDRYRYVQGSSSDDSAWQVVGEYPVGKRVPVYYCPEDPADSLLHPGLEGFDLFVAMFLLPFNLLPIGVFALVVADLGPLCRVSPGGRQDVGRRPRGAGAAAAGGAARRCLPRYGDRGVSRHLPGRFFLRRIPSAKVGDVLRLAHCRWQFSVGLRGHRVVAEPGWVRSGDRHRGREGFASTDLREKCRVQLPLHELTSIEVRDAEPRRMRGGLCYSDCPTLVFTGADGISRAEKLAQWADPRRAESLAAWLRQRLKVEG